MGKTAADTKLEAVYRDCQDLARYIARARNEVAAIQPHDLKAEKLPRAGQELDTIVKETETATNEIMTAAEAIMAADAKDPAKYKTAVEGLCMRVIEACSFQDITGQRIRKVVTTLQHIEQRLDRLQKVWGPDLKDAAMDPAAQPQGDAALLHGPQLHGQGVNQSTVDAMFADAPKVAPGPGKTAAAQKPAAPVKAAAPAQAAAPPPAAAASKQSDIDKMFD